MTTPPDEPTEGEQPSPPSPYGAAPTPPPPAPTYGQYGAPESYSGPPSPPSSQYAAAPGAPYATWITRVGGYFLDGLIIGVPALIIIFIGLAIGHGVGQALAVLGYIAAIGFGIWNVVFRQGATGQTIGKQIIGIKLIRELDGQPVGAGMSFIRSLAHIVDSIACYVGWLWPLWDDKKQTFADKLCSTVVVKV
jgi:uncharacterized RDD family membrane protein YckC